MYWELWIERMYGRIASSAASACARSASDWLLGSLPSHSSTVLTMSVGSSSSETPQSLNFEMIAGSKIRLHESTGASGRISASLPAS